MILESSIILSVGAFILILIYLTRLFNGLPLFGRLGGLCGHYVNVIEELMCMFADFLSSLFGNIV
jgi:hypothetical protein